MTTYEAVTTFSPAGYLCYGRRFVQSFLDHWTIPLTVYHEGQDVDIYHERLTWKNLNHDDERLRFIDEHEDDPTKIGTPEDPNSQSIRFCHKVFAVTGHQVTADWMLWIDADVVTHHKVDQQALDRFCPDGKLLSYLHRRSAPYTECGFIAYRAADHRVKALLDDMRRYYTSGEIFTRPKKDWHDSRCFDICRERSAIKPDQTHFLAPPQPGWHVWPSSVLAPYMEHHKGPSRKQREYGFVVD